ncbi:ribbon-helix-helix domain-containing protein [Caldifermentibacillus hisashii]|uniref:ribbon-helix-helix domain-containing protein n=1 Tax=Caldifermentibacillus hisashii TaxID=996558 RepID=UPI0038CFECBC
MKDRGLKNRKPLSNAVDKTLYDNLDKLAKETKIPKSKLLDEAIELLLEKYKEKRF